MKIIEFNHCSDTDPVESMIFRAEDFRHLHLIGSFDDKTRLKLTLNVEGNIQNYWYIYDNFVDANEDYFDLFSKLKKLEEPNDA